MLNDTRWLLKLMEPWKIAALALLGVLVTGGLGHLMLQGEIAGRFPWIMAAAFCLVFAIFNSISLLASKDDSKLVQQSVACYLALAAGGALLAYLISGLSPKEAGNILPIFMVLTIGYTVFLGIMGAIKGLMRFFDHEEKRKLNDPHHKRNSKKRSRKPNR